MTGPNTVLGKGAPENLQAGDRLWLHPEIPASQSGHYLLIAAFVKGSTNPPPEQWFVKAETWNKQVRKEGDCGYGSRGGAAGFAYPVSLVMMKSGFISKLL